MLARSINLGRSRGPRGPASVVGFADWLRGQDEKTGGTDRSARWGSGSSRQSEMRVVGGYRRAVSLTAKGSALRAEGPGRESWSCLSLGLGLWAFM